MRKPKGSVLPVNLRLTGCLATLVFLFGGCEQAPVSTELLILNGLTMGTSYSVKIVAAKTIAKEQEIQEAINLILEKINQEMSSYRPDSQISRINQNRTTA